MNRRHSLACLSLAAVLCTSVFSVAQAPPADVYQVSYYANATATAYGDQTIRIVNPGLSGSPLTTPIGNVCADIYVYDAAQKLQECCGCVLTPNDLLTLSLANNLLQNPANGAVPTSGVIKLVASSPTGKLNNVCDPTNPTPTPNLRASMAHLELIPPSPAPNFPVFLLRVSTPFLVMAPFQDSTLSGLELGRLISACTPIANSNACKCGP